MDFARIEALEAQLRIALSRTSAPAAQPVIAIDPTNATGVASDNNPGTPTKPFLTLAPVYTLAPAWSNLASTVSINVLSDFPPGAVDWGMDLLVATGGSVQITGTQIVLRTGTLTGYTPENHAANTGATVTDTSLTSWIPYLGNCFIKITSGPHAGAIADVRQNLGGGQARIGNLAVPDPFAVDVGPITIAGNETYQIVRPTKIPPFHWNVDARSGNFNRSVAPLVVQNVQSFDNIAAPSTLGGSGFAQFAACLIGSTTWCISQGNLVQCVETVGSLQSVNLDGFLTLLGGVGYGANWVLNAGGVAEDDYGIEGTVGGNGTVYVSPQSAMYLLAMNTFNTASVFDVAGRLVLQVGGHNWWGQGNTGTNFNLSGDGCLVYGVGYNIYVTGGGPGYSDFTLDGNASTSFYRYDTGAFVAGPTACSFANLNAGYGAGGFNGTVIHSPSNARIVRSATF